MAFQGPERRLRTRFRVRIPFLLRSNGQEVRGTTRNISLLGISGYTHAPLAQVQPVECLLELPPALKPIVANGTVIRCETLPEPHPDGSYEMGVFFKEFEETGESTLTKFLNRISQEEQEALKAGYRAFRQKLAARKRRKRLEALRKKRRRLARLRRRRQRLLQLKRRAAQRRRRRLARRKRSS